ncbi:uncharacterized protein si:zfos-741a10.3 isoform X2 [Megalobrama amblycephala]|uniref:uncharacterized protein si:zfos-741a10.3 isoform X2 n=1 Tax=Megalobrama amblycephala TaxID=75352 RepID=UPI0020143966|nr:uncharacterized protein si:zfos-741a10.3 isoform X2 [Megalobrama amblycephala]
MKLIFGLMLLNTAACLDVNCIFNQSNPCHAALGDKLNLQMADTSKYNLTIKKKISSIEDDPVCKIKKGTIKRSECDLYNKRSEVSVINGILIINGVIRADSGTYRLILEDSDGRETSADLQVIVEAPSNTPIVLGCLAVILVALVITAYYFYKKKNQIKATPSPVSDGPEPVNEHVNQKNREEEQKKPDEYATIDSQNKKKNKKKKKKEEEVHYGEVTFTNSSVQQPRQTKEDCVYSEVHTR